MTKEEKKALKAERKKLKSLNKKKRKGMSVQDLLGIKSFTKQDMTKAINGGPLTMEIHDSTFRNEDGVKKVAALVRAYILNGGHQLQINAVNREKMIDAQKNPEKHQDLIVRVWGWSGHFVELDKCYQNQIIKRVEFDAQ